jgi:hypothetical protein
LKVQADRLFSTVKVSGVFLQWCQAAATKKRTAMLLQRVAGRFRHRTLAPAFEGWALNARQRKQRQAAARKVLVRLLQRSLSMAFVSR